MKNISSQYQELQEGKMTKHQFLRNARMMFPSFVTNQNSFADSVAILKTKGMLVEGDAVKGAPDKEPTYDSPTPDAKTKYKKVEQSPEVDEQDGIYPATTLTDIPKVKANKKVKDTSSGLEPIKDKDTKNEMKKVKVVKESVDIEIKKLIDTKKIDPAKVKAAAEKAMRGDSTELAFLMAFGDKAKPVGENIEPEKIKDAEVEITKNDASIQAMANKLGISQEELFKLLLKRLGGLEESSSGEKSFDDVLKHYLDTDDSTEIKAFIKAKGRDAIAKIKAKLPVLKDQARQKLAKLMKIELDEIRAKQTPAVSIKERLRPAITKLVQEVLDEMGQ